MIPPTEQNDTKFLVFRQSNEYLGPFNEDKDKILVQQPDDNDDDEANNNNDKLESTCPSTTTLAFSYYLPPHLHHIELQILNIKSTIMC